MKVFAWILIVLGISVVIWEGVTYNEFISTETETNLVQEDQSISWGTYAGGAIAIIGTLLLARCDRRKREE